MRSPRTVGVAAIALVPMAFAAPALAHDGHQSTEKTVNFTLNEMNDSGSTAEATLTALDNGSLHVQIEGSGFTANAPHAQHIHGVPDGQSSSADRLRRMPTVMARCPPRRACRSTAMSSSR